MKFTTVIIIDTPRSNPETLHCIKNSVSFKLLYGVCVVTKIPEQSPIIKPVLEDDGKYDLIIGFDLYVETTPDAILAAALQPFGRFTDLLLRLP